ncbi:MAG: hypothetical protein ACLFWG_11895 [Longimicrobiales bacterium]
MSLAVSILIGLSFLGSAVVSLPNRAVEWARHSTPEVVFSTPVPEPMIALTIDDGPERGCERRRFFGRSSRPCASAGIGS